MPPRQPLRALAIDPASPVRQVCGPGISGAGSFMVAGPSCNFPDRRRNARNGKLAILMRSMPQAPYGRLSRKTRMSKTQPLRKTKPWLIGEGNPGWTGDAALPTTKRARCQRRYSLGPCEKCRRPGTDRHHKDGDTGNNGPSNIEILCRRCHMKGDGRLDNLIQIGKRARVLSPKLPCVNCERPAKPLRKGRCGACAEYFRRTGTERPRLP